MITISHNEIVVACRKAFESIGFALGQAEDGADAIGWLAVYGLSLPNDFLSGLKPSNERPKLLHSEPSQSTWDVQGSTALSCFPNLADYAYVQSQKGIPYQITVQNITDIELMWPYLAKIQGRGSNALIRWGVSDQVERRASFTVDSLNPEFCTVASHLGLAVGEVHLTVSQNLIARENTGNPKLVRIDKPCNLYANYLERTKVGIDIDQDLWGRLVETGKGLLVESTAESEKRGAGGV